MMAHGYSVHPVGRLQMPCGRQAGPLKRWSEGCFSFLSQCCFIFAVVRSSSHPPPPFPPHSLFICTSSPPLPPSARALFLRARVFLAAHGAGLSNMVFMPANAAVLEIRPTALPTACFNHLARACSLRYFLSLAQGNRSSSLSADMADVERQVRHIKETMG